MSPHFGLMDPAKMSRAEAALLRSRLHWRGGCRRLRQQKTAAGIATLYDALLHGLRWYFLVHPPECLGEPPAAELERERYLFALAIEAGLIEEAFDLKGLQALIGRVLEGGTVDVNQEGLLSQLERLLTRIGVLPFADSELPAEDPATY